MSISRQEFLNFKSFLRLRSGIALSDSKQYLVSNRLKPLVEDAGLECLSSLLSIIQAKPDGDLAIKAVDAMTTNETFWFRDVSHFNYIESILFSELGGLNAPLRVWSAACSSGQEPYSISLSFEKYVEACGRDQALKIIATDLSGDVLNRAKDGVYTDLELSRGLPNTLKLEHFNRVHKGWQISSRHRLRVSFSQVNLLKDFSTLGQFDIIFCRNVLLYFSAETKINILIKMIQVMKSGAYLFLSSSEVLPREVQGLQVVRVAGCKCYRKV